MEKKNSAKSLRTERLPSLSPSDLFRRNSGDSENQAQEKGKLNVLVANDDSFLIAAYSQFIEDKFNFIVDRAENGLQAFDLVKQKGALFYDAIVLDINMPIMDGIEACNKIYSFLHGEDLIKNMQLRKGMEEPTQNLIETHGKVPAKIYALTADTSDSSLAHIHSQAPHFAGVFDILSEEVVQLIADNAITPLLSVSAMASSDGKGAKFKFVGSKGITRKQKSAKQLSNISVGLLSPRKHLNFGGEKI